jgi:uncharacterized protein with PQ loop repeat
MHDIIQIVSGVLMTFFYLVCGIPQIVKTFKTKSAKDISIGTVALSALGHSSATIYAFYGSNNFWTFVCYFGGLLTAAMMFGLWFKYGR